MIPQTGVDNGNQFPTSDVYSSETTYQRYLFRHTIGGAIDSIQFKVLMGSAPATFYLDDFSITIEEL